MELSKEELNHLEKLYNRHSSDNQIYFPEKVESFEKLTAEEQKFFDKNNFVSPNFSVQTLYKVSGNIIPIRFNRAVHSMMVAEKNLRSNFYNLGNKVVKIIFDKYLPIPEVTYRNFTQYEDDELDAMLARVMEADRRLTFDLSKGRLMRFSVFRTKENECAVLITMPKLIEGSFNANSFFLSVFSKNDYKSVDRKSNFEIVNVENSVREYWKKVLLDLPPVKGVPFSKKARGIYQEKVFREKIPEDIVSELRKVSQSNKMMLMTILQTAWGFLLQAFNKVDDTSFCQLAETSANKNSFTLNVIPIRLKSLENETVESIVNKQFRQMIVSQPYSFFDWESLKDIISSKGVQFDHFLSFLDFKTEQTTYSQTEGTPLGKVVVKNSWDTCGMKLGVYFQYTNTNISFTVTYDANQFSLAVGMRFAEVYNLILKKMLRNWKTSFVKFITGVTKQVLSELEISAEEKSVEARRLITDFISTNKILQGEHSGTITLFAESASVINYFEGDRIQGNIIDNNLVFVVDGKIARSIDTGDGWYNTLDIISKGGWLNETVLLEKRRSKIAAEVLTEQATILFIPLQNVDTVLRQYPSVYKNFMNQFLSQMEKYQILWLQS